MLKETGAVIHNSGFIQQSSLYKTLHISVRTWRKGGN